MTTATITEQYILDAMQQEKQGERFPILFDDIWQASGYTNQRNAARFLTKRCEGLKENEHYLIVSKRSEVNGVWVSTKTIYLSMKAYRFFLSKSNTKQGDANLWYLLEVEDRYREHLERQLVSSEQSQNFNKELNQLKYQVQKFKTSSEFFDKLTKYMAKRINKTSKMQLDGHFKLALLQCCINFCHEYQEEFNFTKAQYRAKIAYLKDKVNEALSESEQLSYAFDIDMSEMYPEEFKAMNKALEDDFATFVYVGETKTTGGSNANSSL